MSDLMTRRRELTPAASEPGEWDSVWEFTDGSPATKGWTQNGTPRTMTASGLPVRNCYFTKDLAITNGVIEAKFVISNYRPEMNSSRAWMRIGDTANCVYVTFYRYSNRVATVVYNQNLANSPKIAGFTWEWDGEYVVRLTINGAVGKLEINGVTILNDIDTSLGENKGALMFGNRDAYGESVWQYVKYKNLG